jgi:4-amino-4-deoxy-L-arabinose transferase-like glycosyltransferase
VTGLALLLRIGHLTSVGLGSDEAVYARQGDALLASTAGGSIWPEVRAHPPLLGLLVTALPGGPDGDLAPRLLVAGFGVLTVVLTGLLGRRVAGPVAGLLAAGVLAADPYHVDVSRQVLVDVPMAACVTAGLLAAASWLATWSRRALVTAAASLGIATLFKETAALSAVAVLVLVLGASRGRPTPGRVSAALVYILAVGVYPVLLLAVGGLPRAGEYLHWQVARPANTEIWFYLTTVLPRIGPLVVAAAVLGAVGPLRVRGDQSRLLLLAVTVPLGFYLMWPTKGYPYLTAVLPPLAVLAGAGVQRLPRLLTAVGPRPSPAPARRRALGSVAVATALGAALVAVPATARSTPPPVAGAGGVPAVREAARWLATRPTGQVLTADTGVANIVAYYSGRHATAHTGDTGLPAAHNPAYRAVSSSASSTAETRFFVWDAWSAASDPAAAAGLVAAARGRRARVAHVEAGDPRGADGPATPLVVVFEVGR